MTEGGAISIENKSPNDVWNELSKEKNAALVDCRTAREWEVIGAPDLQSIDKNTHLVEWRSAPDMSVNPNFIDQLDEVFGGTYPDKIFFICRSGARSFEAATVVQNALTSRNIVCECVNVAEGVEGDPGPGGERSTVNGWKFNNLPWQKI